MIGRENISGGVDDHAASVAVIWDRLQMSKIERLGQCRALDAVVVLQECLGIEAAELTGRVGGIWCLRVELRAAEETTMQAMLGPAVAAVSLS